MEQLVSLEKLIGHFAKLPGVGVKTAQRLAYYIITQPEEEVAEFAKNMCEARAKIRQCKVCGNLSEDEVCSICASPVRDASTICVVKDSKDARVIEKTNEYRGLYHILGGVLAPLEGVGPDDIAVVPLLKRLESGDVKEVIIATNPDVAGEATAAYIARLIEPLGIEVTRIAHGIPVGAELEYADEVTIAKALEGRQKM